MERQSQGEAERWEGQQQGPGLQLVPSFPSSRRQCSGGLSRRHSLDGSVGSGGSMGASPHSYAMSMRHVAGLYGSPANLPFAVTPSVPSSLASVMAVASGRRPSFALGAAGSGGGTLNERHRLMLQQMYEQPLGRSSYQVRAGCM